MNTPTLYDSDAEIDKIERQAISDEKHMQGISNMMMPHAVLMARQPPAPNEIVLPALETVTRLALGEANAFANEAFKKARAELKKLHGQYEVIVEQIEDSRPERVAAEYRRLTALAGEGVTNGDPDALEELESEQDITTRFKSEIDGLQEGSRLIGHAQIPHMIVLRDVIDDALAALISTMEARDAADCARFGIPADHFCTTKVAQSVRLHAYKRFMHLRQMALLGKDEMVSPNAHHLFSDYLGPIESW